MPNDKQVEAVDHRKEVEKALHSVGGEQEPDWAVVWVQEAQVHATLALVDEVRAVRESLGGGEIKDALIGEIQHVGQEFIEIFWRANGGRN